MKCRTDTCNHNAAEGTMPRSAMWFEKVPLADGRVALLTNPWKAFWRNPDFCWRYRLLAASRNWGSRRRGLRHLRSAGLL